MRRRMNIKIKKTQRIESQRQELVEAMVGLKTSWNHRNVKQKKQKQFHDIYQNTTTFLMFKNKNKLKVNI